MRIAAFEKGVEVPPTIRPEITSFGQIIDLKATIDQISPGESFLLDEEWMRKRALMTGKQKGVELTSRKEEKRFRIWRKL